MEYVVMVAVFCSAVCVVVVCAVHLVEFLRLIGGCVFCDVFNADCIPAIRPQRHRDEQAAGHVFRVSVRLRSSS